MLSLAGANPKLAGAAKLIVAGPESSFAQEAATDPILTVSNAPLKEGIETARARAGVAPMDQKSADDYATRAADLIRRLVISKNAVLDVSPVRGNLLAALNDERPQIAETMGDVVSMMQGKDAQAALLARAADDKTPKEVRISLYQSLASTIKNNGNLLDSDQTSSLMDTVRNESDLNVRSAAAEALGAMNLPANDPSKLILEQSKI